MFSLGDGLGGGKTIGWVGSLCLLVNNITGPAMLSIGTVFAQAGWVPSVLLFVLCGVLACFASVFLRLAIESLGGNIGFTRRVEITDAVKERRAPRWAFLCSFWGFILLFIASNVSAIVEPRPHSIDVASVHRVDDSVRRRHRRSERVKARQKSLSTRRLRDRA